MTSSCERPALGQGTSPAGADILILSNYYHPEPTGSAPPISDLSFWLAEHGAAARVLTARPSYPLGRVFDGYRRGEKDGETLRGVGVQRLASFVPARRGMAGRLAGELSFACAAIAARIFGRTRPAQYVICVCPSTFAVAAAPLLRRRGGRVLCIVHDIQSGLASALGFGLGRAAVGALKALEAWSLNRCDVVVALSDEMAQALRELGVRRPLLVIPPQVDVSEITPQPEPEGRPPLLLYSGNLGRKQGLDQVLDLADELLRRGSGAQILIRGEGSERPALEALAADRRLTNVRFADLARREDLSAALAEGLVHLAPQNPDGASFAVPSKIFSIMAARRCFIATARPSSPLWRIAEQSGAGLCTAPYDAAAFADAVEALISSPERRGRMGEAGRRFVEQEVDRQVVCRATWEAVAGSREGLAAAAG